MRSIESYKGYDIEAIVRELEDQTFTAYGYIRNPNAIGTDFPFEISFKSGERCSTEYAALIGGIAFAKKKIDGTRETVPSPPLSS